MGRRALRRRVVLTGVGVVTPALHGGAAALGRWLAIPADARPAGTVPDARLAELIDEAEARRLSRISRLTIAAARLAVADAGLAAIENAGVVVGTEFGDLRSTVAFADGYLDSGPGGLSALLFPNTVMNAMAAATTIAVRAEALSLTLTSPTLAGELAVARAAALVAAGRVDVALAGGVDERDAFLETMLGELGVPGVRGEGATVLVLEPEADALARGARVLGEVVATGCRSLRARPHGIGRSPEGRAIAAALGEAGLERTAIRWVYHAVDGDPERDAWEERLLTAAFGDSRPPRAALTPRLGQHAGGGALTIAAAADTARSGRLPTAGGPAVVAPGVGLVHAVARGGTEIAVVVGPP